MKTMKTMKQNLFILFMSLICSMSYSQKVAVIGLNHQDADGFSFVVIEDLPNGEVIYFTENEYDNVANVFNGTNTEAIVKFTFSSAVAKGNVIHVAETGTTTNLFTVSCTGGGTCGTAVRVTGTGPFSIGEGGESFYAYSDTDDNPNNGLTTIHSVLYTGFSEGTNFFPGGNIIASQDPTPDYPNAIVVDGFPAVAIGISHNRVEFIPTALARTNVTKVILENVNNYVHGQPNAPLSTIFFTNLNLASSNPVVSVTASPSSVNENSGISMVYTFSLSANAAANMTINFTVGGTATLGTDYNQSGAASFSSSTGTVIIPSGSNSATVTVTPIGDTDLEPNETIILTITSGSGYDAGSPSTAVTTIVNDDSTDMEPMVAITGISHTDPDAFSFVAVQDIPANTVIYFTDHSFSTATLRFSTSSPEGTLAWTSPGSVIPKGHVIVVTETATSSNAFNVTCSSGSCGGVSIQGEFAIASAGETFYAYRDTDNNPDNGITSIDSALFTGTSAVSGGIIPAIENPISVYTKAIVVSGFPSIAPLRTEYNAALRNLPVSDAVFQNLTNWVHAQSPPALSTVPFTNLNILCSTPPTPTFTQVDPICSGETLAALPTVSNNGINGTWSPALNNTATTEYTFTPNAGECGTTTTMTIVVNPNVTPTFTQVNPICSGATLAALPTVSNNGINGTWSPALNNMATTTYTFSPNSGECASSTTMTIVVNPILVPTFTQVDPICSGATLEALPTVSNNGINGTWSPALNNTATTEYTFTPNAGECASSTTMTIVVNPIITPTFTQVNPICSGETLAALPTVSNNGINGTWSPALNNTATTEYTFTPNTGECGTTTTMTIVVNPNVAPSFTQVDPICSGATLEALPTVSNNGINGTWSPALNNTATTEYTFTPNSGECASSTTMTIVVNPIIVPTFTQVDPICAGEMLSALPTTSNNGITGTWSPALNNMATTTYTFTPSNGVCITSATMTIVVNEAVVITANESETICEGNSIVLSPTVNLPAGTVGFVGPYAGSNWVQSSENSDGSIIFTDTNSVMISGNNSSNLSGFNQALITIPTNATITFDWSYSTDDGAEFDYPQYYLNGNIVLLNGFDNSFSGPLSQSGSQTIAVQAGDVFGFRIFTTDNIFGSATVTITNFQASGNQLEYAWTASNGGVVNGPANLSTLEVNTAGTYTVTVTNLETGCSDSKEIVVNSCGPTTLRPDFCDVTLADIGSNIYSVAVPNAQQYTFEVTNLSTMAVNEVVRPVRWFNLINAGLNPTYSTIYSIRVKAQINGIYDDYGLACVVTTPDLGTITLRSDFCNTTLATAGTNIYAQTVKFATEYTFEVTNSANVVTEVVRSVRFFNLINAGFNPQPNEVYSIRVKAFVYGVYNEYGDACNVMVPGINTILNHLENVTIAEAISAYPNPFENLFTIKLTNDASANIELFDIHGKLIESRQVQDTFEVIINGDNLSSGVYFIRIEQGLENEYIKMVKR